MRSELPSGTVTFLFTDVEGSTRLLRELGAEGYAEALAEHRRVVRAACVAEGGVEVDTQGDAFFFSFPTAPGALEAAQAITQSLASGLIHLRIGLHTGTPLLTGEGYVGDDVHFAARVAASAHGGQVVLSQATRDLLDGHLVSDLGEHRLKDIDGPVAIYQLGEERFPPLKTISNTNLPRPASSFVGRDKEVGEVASLLQDGARLLTLSGPGGSGKTRLAIEAAATLVPEFKAGVFWVGLAPLRDPALVAETIGQTLGAKDGLVEHIAERELLLLLDNLEQVVDAAPELASLVEACPNLRLLVTSRELLRVRGEVEYPVLPLAEPDAVELFRARARTEPDASVHELCRRLDNLPLALELAAARTKALSPAQIVERLSKRLDLFKGGRDADPRQQTLRATIAWSYDLLSPEEKELFGRISVFAGGCTLEAAEEVAGADLDILQSLVEKSLLRFTNERYWMLETIREYAVEELDASGEAEELRDRHARFFLALALEAEPHVELEWLEGGSEWHDLLEGELDNLRTALDSLEAAGEAEEFLQMSGALSDFWIGRGHVAEGRAQLERALSADTGRTAARARALNGASEMASRTGDDAQAGLLSQEALDLYRMLGDRRGIARSLSGLGYTAGEGGDWLGAQQLLRESLELFHDLGDEHEAVWITRTLAFAHAQAGDLGRARELYEDGLLEAQELGSKSAEAALLGSLAWLAVTEGRARDALSLLRQSLTIKRDIGDRGELAIGMCSAARALTAVGRVETAARLISCFESLRDEIGSGEAWVARMNRETLPKIRAQLDAATFAKVWEEGRALTIDHAVTLALGELERDA
jgi:predicted ATPase